MAERVLEVRVDVDSTAFLRKLRRAVPLDPDSNLVKHARRELEILGEDEETILGYLYVIQAFADMGHSGGSAMIAIPTINDLLQFNNLKPLTNDLTEWQQLGPDMWNGGQAWQNRRNGRAFSEDAGKTYYFVDDPEKTLHTSEVVI